MAEVDKRQKASDACDGRVSHERGGGGRGGRMCQDQSIVHAGLLLLSSAPPPRYFSLSSTFAFFSFIGTAVFLAIAFLRSIDPTHRTLSHIFPRETRDHLTLVMCIDLYFTALIIPIFGFSSFDLCNTVGSNTFVTDVYHGLKYINHLKQRE